MENTSDIEKLITEIKKLTTEATSSLYTKPKAKPFIDSLKSLEYRLPKNNPALKHMFSEFVCHVKEASGHGRNKEHWLSLLSRDLILIEQELRRTNKD